MGTYWQAQDQISKYSSRLRRIIDAKANDKGEITNITWKQKPVDKKEGYYVLRTTMDDKDE